MVSKTNQVLKNQEVLTFLTALFPTITNVKELGDGNIEIETDNFLQPLMSCLLITNLLCKPISQKAIALISPVQSLTMLMVWLFLSTV